MRKLSKAQTGKQWIGPSGFSKTAINKPSTSVKSAGTGSGHNRNRTYLPDDFDNLLPTPANPADFVNGSKTAEQLFKENYRPPASGGLIPFDPVGDAVNPLSIIESLGSIPGQIQQGDYLGAGMNALEAVPFAGSAFRGLKRAIPNTPGAKSYVKDLLYSVPKGKLPTYTNATRWQPDAFPKSLIKAGESLTPEQKVLTGSWFGYGHPETSASDIGFYQHTRPGPGNVNVLRLSERQIKELENTMPSTAKGMSGKANSVSHSDDYKYGELIVPENLRKSAKSIRFDINPTEYAPDPLKVLDLKNIYNISDSDPIIKNYLQNATGRFTNDVIESQYPNFAKIIPRKYFPYKNGGSLPKAQTAGSWKGPEGYAGKQKYVPKTIPAAGVNNSKNRSAQEIVDKDAYYEDAYQSPLQILSNVQNREEQGWREPASGAMIAIDPIGDAVNPLEIINSIASIPTQIAEGNYLEAGLNSLELIPFVRSFKGIKLPRITKNKVDTNQVPNFDNKYEDYFNKLKVKEYELQKLHASGKINYETYVTDQEKHQQELLKDLGVGSRLGSGGFGEVYEFADDPSKVIKLGNPYGNRWTPELIESLKSVKQNANIAIPYEVQDFEVSSMYKNYQPQKKQVVIMPNLNKMSSQNLNLNKRDRYALFLKQARQLRDRGIALDVKNHENFKFNKDKGVFDIYDINPGVENPVYYMQYIKDRTKEDLLDNMLYKTGGSLHKAQTAGSWKGPDGYSGSNRGISQPKTIPAAGINIDTVPQTEGMQYIDRRTLKEKQVDQEAYIQQKMNPWADPSASGAVVPFDPIGDAVNPLLIIEGLANIPGDIREGNYLSAGMNALEAVPFLGAGFKGLRGVKFPHRTNSRLGTKQLPGSSNVSSERAFKSEIDWSKWNKEIPENNALMQEYNAIEKASKSKGTWMKNPDGSKFEGTPEQFVQQNSENFKKAFPEGFDETYRGVSNFFNTNKLNEPLFTGDISNAKHYAATNNPGFWNVNKNIIKEASKFTDPIPQSPEHLNMVREASKTGDWSKVRAIEYNDVLNSNAGGVHSFYSPKSKNNITIDAKGKEWTNIPYEGREMPTDFVAEDLFNKNLDYININNVRDPRIGDLKIINPNRINAKSARGNNGMFDMTNPNIYKGLAPAAIIGAGAASQQEYQEGGEKKEDIDSWIENLVEVIDPTGVTSYDDVYRAYKNSGLSQELFIEAIGALPVSGKFGKVAKTFSKFAIEQLKNPNVLKGTSKRGMPIAPFALTGLGMLATAPYWGRVTDAVQAATGSKDGSGYKPNAGSPTYNGRNIFPSTKHGEETALDKQFGKYQEGGENLIDMYYKGSNYPYRIQDETKRNEQIKNLFYRDLDEIPREHLTDDNTVATQNNFKKRYSHYGSDRGYDVGDLYPGFDYNDYNQEMLDRLVEEYLEDYYSTEKPKKQAGGTNPPIIVRNPRDPRLQAYQDSLKLFNSYQDLRKKLIASDYENIGIPNLDESGFNTPVSEESFINFIKTGKGKDGFLDKTKLSTSELKKADPKKIGSLYSVKDFYNGQINEELPSQLFSNIIKPKSKEAYEFNSINPFSDHYKDRRLVYNYENVNPKQKVLYVKEAKEIPIKSLPVNKKVKEKEVKKEVEKEQKDILEKLPYRTITQIPYNRPEQEFVPLDIPQPEFKRNPPQKFYYGKDERQEKRRLAGKPYTLTNSTGHDIRVVSGDKRLGSPEDNTIGYNNGRAFVQGDRIEDFDSKFLKKQQGGNSPIVDPQGQYNHPGKTTRIPSPRITMKDVNYPVLGISDKGRAMLMLPGMEYLYLGASYVDEIPLGK